MPCAMFGKLIAKRDFVSVGTPRDLLLAWEGWLQASIASSKNELQGRWLEAYLSAPLWRFWLGPEICGVAVQGVFMSSMDGVGRHFPLTVFTFADAGARFPTPTDALEQAWFEQAEHFLLSTIDAGEDYDAVLAQFSALPVAGVSDAGEASPGIVRHGARIAWSAVPAADAAAPPPIGFDDQPAALEALPAPIPPAEADVEEGEAAAPITIDADDIAANSVDGSQAAEAVPASADEDEAVSQDASPAIETATDVPVWDMPATISDLPSNSASEALDGAVGEPSIAEASAGTPLAMMPAAADDRDLGAAALGELARPAGFGFAVLAEMEAAVADRRRSYWWTIGGHDLPAMAIVAEGMPDPQVMTVMLTGVPAQAAS